MQGDDQSNEHWLDTLPLEQPIEIDGKWVCLRLRPGGAELEGLLFANYTQQQLEYALNQGFSSAIVFDAGLGESVDGRNLVLNQWLPEANGWRDAAKALENLLNQLDAWFSVMTPALRPSAVHRGRRSEGASAQRLRELIGSRK